MRILAYIIIIAIVAFAAFFVVREVFGPGSLTEDFDLTSDSNSRITSESTNTPPQSSPYKGEEGEIMITDGVKHLVPLDKITSGGPAKDGIPSIDEPKFISVKEADELLDDNKLGIAVEKKNPSGSGEASKWRFYPFQILVWHEIVNDVFDDENILVTYCPLCGTGIVFTPQVDGEFVEFGTSGRLYNSNLVMYDRKTDSLWSQQGGRAIVGTAVGQTLEVRAADNLFWSEFKKVHPDAKVLSQDTGFARNYKSDPYGDYYTSGQLIFGVENEDDRLHKKAIVYGLKINNQAKAYSEEALKRDILVNDVFADTSILAVVDPESSQAIRFFDRVLRDSELLPTGVSGQLESNLETEKTLNQVQGDKEIILTFELKNGKIFDTKTNSEWNFGGEAISGVLVDKTLTRINPEFGFWFSWAAFNPETELYD